jgi:hypothetical protein
LTELHVVGRDFALGGPVAAFASLRNEFE